MTADITPTFAVRLDYATALVESSDRARMVGTILARPCFATLARVAGRSGDRHFKAVRSTAAAITERLLDRKHESVVLLQAARGEVVASGQIQQGTYPAERVVAATRFYAYLALPVPEDPSACVDSLCEMAGALGANAGFVAVEAGYSRAQEVALGGFRPRTRPGLSEQRLRERRGRDWKHARIHEEVAGLEWGMFLGPGHLGKIDLQSLRDCAAVHRVVDVVPDRLAFLQVTVDPVDELRDGFEERLAAVRVELGSSMLNVFDVPVDVRS